jgi:hypothetical protein
MGLTKAEKHNRMLDRVFDNYNKHQKSLPNVHLYSRYLDIAVEKLNISRDDARNKYGLYTVEQWEKLLNLGWNKS